MHLSYTSCLSLFFFFFLRLIRLVWWWWKPMGALTSYEFPCWWIERERSLVLKLQEPSAASGADYPQPLPQGAVAPCTQPLGTLNLCSAQDQSHSSSASQNCRHRPLLCLPQDKFSGVLLKEGILAQFLRLRSQPQKQCSRLWTGSAVPIASDNVIRKTILTSE